MLIFRSKKSKLVVVEIYMYVGLFPEGAILSDGLWSKHDRHSNGSSEVSKAEILLGMRLTSDMNVSNCSCWKI